MDTLETIIVFEGEGSKALSDLLFLGRMDGVGVADVQGGRDSCMGNLLSGLHLRFLQEAALEVFRIVIAVWGDLDGIERHFGIFPDGPHHLHIGLAEPQILLRTAPVGLALIPDDALESEGYDGLDHAVEKKGWLLMGTVLGSDSLLEV